MICKRIYQTERIKLRETDLNRKNSQKAIFWMKDGSSVTDSSIRSNWRPDNERITFSS